MSTLAFTAITNFVLGAEATFFGGYLLGRSNGRRSAQSAWGMVLLVLGLASLIGGVDHGFFHPNGDTLERLAIQRLAWALVGFVTFFMLLTIVRQYVATLSMRRLIVAVGTVQLVLYLIIIVFSRRYLVVVVKYAPPRSSC